MNALPLETSWIGALTAVFSFLILLGTIIRWYTVDKRVESIYEKVDKVLMEAKTTNGRLNRIDQWVLDHEKADAARFASVETEIEVKTDFMSRELIRVRDRLDLFMDNRIRSRVSDLP